MTNEENSNNAKDFIGAMKGMHEQKEDTSPEESQEGKSLDELAGEGHIATPETDDAPVLEIDKEGNIVMTPETEAEIMKPADFKTGIFGMRGDIELVKSKVKNWQGHPEIVPSLDDVSSITTERLCELSEAQQNIILAYRHLEDSRMRLGKAIQAFDGGKSCYPR